MPMYFELMPMALIKALYVGSSDLWAHDIVLKIGDDNMDFFLFDLEYF